MNDVTRTKLIIAYTAAFVAAWKNYSDAVRNTIKAMGDIAALSSALSVTKELDTKKKVNDKEGI